MVRQGEKHRPLVALEAVDRTLPGRGMPADVGCALQPAHGLLVEIVVIRKRAAVEEALADVADRALHFALGLGPIGSARARHEPPVRGEPQELLVQHQAAAGAAVVGQHHGAHLVEQQLLRNPAEPVEGALQTFHQDRHGLPSIELQPQQPGVAEDDHQGMAPAPGQRERTEVHLALMPRRRLEPDQRCNRFARSRRTHVVVHARVAARVARSADLIEKPLRRQLRERLKTGVDDCLVGGQLVGHRRTGRIPSRTGGQIPVQLAGIDPIVDRPTIHPEPPRQLRLRDAPVQIVLQQHPDLPFVHPRTDPVLLAKPTERTDTPSATSPK